MSHIGACEFGWSFITLSSDIPAKYLPMTLGNPTALQQAYSVGVLELVSIALTVLGTALAVFAVFGFWIIRREAIAVAKETADEHTPRELKKYMNANASDLMRECFKDPEVVSAMQAAMIRLGIRDAADADNVDTDAENPETGEAA